mgnify:CR=1 FL=1
MATPVTNFGKATVSTGYDASATSIVLTTGHGSRLPSTFSYPLSWWNSTDYSDPADDPNKEIVIVTNRAGDTLTVTRAGEGTTATTKNTASKTYKMVLGITKAMWEQLNDRALSQTFRGLSLQTHPDNDKAPAQVSLIHADAIVMHDGEEVTDWNNVNFDIAAATGIGGLDTGTEQASTWYKIWAMYNGTTKGLMGQRAKDYFLDEDITAGEDASQGLRSAVDNSTVRISQGFQLGTAGLIEFINVKLIKTGTPTGNYWFTIEANNGGVPSNTPLATSDKYNVSRLTTTACVVRLPFRTPFSASAATQYHVVMYGDFTVSATNFASWRMDGSAATYANGSKALFDSDTSTWTTDTDDDMWLQVYVTRNDTSLVVPTGYRYAHVGWVYNDSGSNFKHFWALDRRVFCGYDDSWQIGALTSTTPLLVSLFEFLPPVAMRVSFLHYNGTVSYIGLGDLPVTDLTLTQTDELIGSIRNYNAGVPESIGPLTLNPFQGIMFITTGGTMALYVSSFEF